MSEMSENTENNRTSNRSIDIWKYRKFPKKVKTFKNARDI